MRVIVQGTRDISFKVGITRSLTSDTAMPESEVAEKQPRVSTMMTSEENISDIYPSSITRRPQDAGHFADMGKWCTCYEDGKLLEPQGDHGRDAA